MSLCDRPITAETCDDICRYGIRCRNKAKWLTPKTKYAEGGRRVCGLHKARHETFFARCQELSK